MGNIINFNNDNMGANGIVLGVVITDDNNNDKI